MVRWTMAVLMLGAAAVHFGAMGEHAGVSWTHGLFFAVAAWAQVVLACWLVLRPSRTAVVTTVLVNFAIVVVWVASRTIGIAIGTDGTPEPVAFPDALCTVLEATAIAGGLLLISDGLVRRRVHAAMGWIAVAATGVAVTALTSLGFTPALASGSSGQSHAHDTSTSTTSVAGVAPHSHNVDEAAELQPDQPLAAATRATLAHQLVVARQVALEFPTVADAKAAGYIQAGKFAPGAGAHYVLTRGSSGGFDPGAPGSLIYEGISDTSRIVGLMYLSLNGQIPEGFAGPNDHWHRHQNVCVKYGAGGIEIPFPADSDVTSAMCSGAGGRLLVLTTWMVHAWVVPGWESPQGVFSHANPNVRCADGTMQTDAVGFCQGV
ncbi:MAG: hypothetical protein WD271_01515 [Acidimicrobiia bacterium]